MKILHRPAQSSRVNVDPPSADGQALCIAGTRDAESEQPRSPPVGHRWERVLRDGPIPARSKVAELFGERIGRAEAKKRISGRRRIRICDVDERTAIDANVGGEATAFINHSCQPNLFTRVVGGHVLFFALRDIEPGEELTIDYQASPHSDSTRCMCGASGCRGTINRLS